MRKKHRPVLTPRHPCDHGHHATASERRAAIKLSRVVVGFGVEYAASKSPAFTTNDHVLIFYKNTTSCTNSPSTAAAPMNIHCVHAAADGAPFPSNRADLKLSRFLQPPPRDAGAQER